LIPHPTLGGDLAEKYALPAEVVAAIRQHHAPEAPDGMLQQIAWLGESIAAVFESPDVERARLAAVARARKINVGAAQIKVLV
jgi:HD-like signal output (HDOD) protein